MYVDRTQGLCDPCWPACSRSLSMYWKVWTLLNENLMQVISNEIQQKWKYILSVLTLDLRFRLVLDDTTLEMHTGSSSLASSTSRISSCTSDTVEWVIYHILQIALIRTGWITGTEHSSANLRSVTSALDSCPPLSRLMNSDSILSSHFSSLAGIKFLCAPEPELKVKLDLQVYQ